MRRLIDTLRLQHGLRWQTELPEATDLGFNLVNLLLMLVILLAYGIAGSMDYATEKAIEAERQAERATQHQAALLGCLNGHDTGLVIERSGQRHRIVCGDSFEISEENTGGRRL